MSLSDPIADLLTRIRNASCVYHEKVRIPYSNTKEEILKVLLYEGYISDYQILGGVGTVKKDLEATLKYGPNNERVIQGLKRVSRPGLRVYVKSQKIPRILNGIGITILSTSKGVKSGEVARKNNIGGEILCNVW